MEWPREVVLRQAFSDVEQILNSPRMERRLADLPETVAVVPAEGEG